MSSLVGCCYVSISIHFRNEFVVLYFSFEENKPFKFNALMCGYYCKINAFLTLPICSVRMWLCCCWKFRLIRLSGDSFVLGLSISSINPNAFAFALWRPRWSENRISCQNDLSFIAFHSFHFIWCMLPFPVFTVFTDHIDSVRIFFPCIHFPHCISFSFRLFVPSHFFLLSSSWIVS